MEADLSLALSGQVPKRVGSSSRLWSIGFSNSVLAYDFDEEGRIAYAPDFGTEGDLEGASSSKSKFPTLQRYGWWENEMMEVLFESRS